MNKKDLRIQYKQNRKEISPKNRAIWNDLMLIQFQHLSFESVHQVLSYWPMEHLGEPDTHLFTRYLKLMLPDVQIAYPVCDISTNKMEAKLVDDETVFVTNSLGITEPREGKLVHPNSLDVVFVPNLVCSQTGYRVGYGKGFYDRYLVDCKPDVTLIGFNYFEPVASINDIGEWDIPLHFLITPEQIFEF